MSNNITEVQLQLLKADYHLLTALALENLGRFFDPENDNMMTSSRVLDAAAHNSGAVRRHPRAYQLAALGRYDETHDEYERELAEL